MVVERRDATQMPNAGVGGEETCAFIYPHHNFPRNGFLFDFTDGQTGFWIQK